MIVRTIKTNEIEKNGKKGMRAKVEENHGLLRNETEGARQRCVERSIVENTYRKKRSLEQQKKLAFPVSGDHCIREFGN